MRFAQFEPAQRIALEQNTEIGQRLGNVVCVRHFCVILVLVHCLHLRLVGTTMPQWSKNATLCKN